MHVRSLLSLVCCALYVTAQSHGMGVPAEAGAAGLAHVERSDAFALSAADLDERSFHLAETIKREADEFESLAMMRRSTRSARAKAAARRAAARRKAAAAEAAKKRAARKAAKRRAALRAKALERKKAQRAAAARRKKLLEQKKHHHSSPPPAHHKSPAHSAKPKTVHVSSGNAIVSQSHTGDATYFSVGLGACGWTNTDAQNIVAVSHILYDAYPGATPNPNDNPVCGRKVQTTYNGVTQVMTVVDKCMACAEYDLDFSPTAFARMAPLSAGRLHGMTWQFL